MIIQLTFSGSHRLVELREWFVGFKTPNLFWSNVLSAKWVNLIFSILTWGVCSATDLDPWLLIRFSWRSNLSEEELNTQLKYRLSEGLATTSQLTWIFSRLATPYTFVWSGLQNGLTEKKKKFFIV